jgi:cysteine desulfurase
MPQANCQQRWVVKLDKAGFAVSTGSACSSGKEKPSHVLQAMDLPDDASSRMLRFSSGWQTSKAEWNQLADAIFKVNSEMARS